MHNFTALSQAMSVATTAATAAATTATTATLALATDGLDSLEHILTAPLDIPRLAWEPLDKEFVIQLYTALRTQTDSEIREGIAYGRRRILDIDPIVATTEAADFFRDVTDRLHKDYAHNYYYMARRFYPIDSMEEPDSDDSDYEEQLAEHNYYMSLPEPVPHLLESYPQFADIDKEVVKIAYELFDIFLQDLHVVALDYVTMLKEKIDAIAAADV